MLLSVSNGTDQNPQVRFKKVFYGFLELNLIRDQNVDKKDKTKEKLEPF